MRAIALALLLAAGPAGAAQVLTVEDRVDPIGVGDRTPEFAWRDDDGRTLQRAWQVQVASSAVRLRAPDLWDSGRVESASSAFVSYAGAPLRSRQQAFWRVRTWSAAGPGPWSAISRFEMGLLDDPDWEGARWMWSDAPVDREAHVHFRARVPASGKRVVRARAYVTAMHRYELFVDGARVGYGPAFAYPEYQLYQTLDVTSAFAGAREHVVGLTARWYGDGQGRPAGRGGVLLKLVVDYADGTSAVLDSGPAWRFRPAEWRVPDAPISPASFRNGEGIPVETVDAREAPVGWTVRGYDDSGWKPAVDLGPHPTAPWTGPLLAQETAIDERELAPVALRTLGPGRVVADFGKVYAGRPRVAFPAGRAGAPVTVTTDYRTLPDGSLAGFAQSTKMDYAYVQRGGRETFEPFGYLGFRYVQVDFPAGQVPPTSVTLLARWNRLPATRATFRSSDPTLDAVFALAVHSAQYGAQDQFVDTPTREQGQFTYDAYQISRAAMRAFGERDLTQRALREFAQSQVKFHADTGKVNAVYPNGDGKRDIPDWTQAWPVWAWEYFRETGDTELVSDLFPQLVRTGEYVLSTESRTTGLVDLGNDPGYRSGIVDWPNRYGYDRTTTQRTVMTLNAVLVYRAIAGLADAIGRGDVADRSRAAQRRAEQSLDRLWDPAQGAYVDGLYADGRRSPHASQQANAMMLALGLVPADRVRGVEDAVRRAGFETSPVLSRFLVEAYGEQDLDEALYDFLLNPKGRNFASILAQGGTFTWESWEGSAAKSENSESHAYGANAALLAIQRYVLGVEAVEPQAARVRIRPHFGPLAFADGAVPTERGLVRVSWRAPHELDVRLPENVSADVSVPASSDLDRVMLDGHQVGTRDGARIVVRDVPPGAHAFRVVTQAQAPSPSPDARTIRDVVTAVARHQLKPLEAGTYARGSWEQVLANTPPKGLTWTYQYGVTLYGLLRATDATGDKTFADFVADHDRKASAYASYLRWVDRTYGTTQKEGVDALLQASGFRRFVRLDRLDFCGAMGHSMLESVLRHGVVPDEAESEILDYVADHIQHRQGRIEGEGVLFRPEAKDTLWIDDLYMSCPFLVRRAAQKNDPSLLDDAARQVKGFARRQQDADGLWYHAAWVKENRRSPYKWGRANGWAMVTTVEVLSALPGSHPDRAALVDILRRHVAGVAKHQKPSGLWPQVLDHPELWDETSCSAMFAYAIARGVRRGWLPPEDLEIARRAYAGVMRNVTPDGQVLEVSEGTSIGETLEYYRDRQRPVNDHHGPGPVMFAGAELIEVDAESAARKK